MGAGASIPVEKWSAYRLAAYSNEKSLPIYITKIIDNQQLNGATILNLSEYDIKRFTNKKDKQDELWKHCKMLQRIASRNRGKDISVDDDVQSETSEQSNKRFFDGKLRPPDELFHLPYHLRNIYFTGRETDLEIIQQSFFPEKEDEPLKDKNGKIKLKSFSISGLGGIGKTALAARYAEVMYYEKYKYSGGVYFINGDSQATLHDGYKELATYQLHIKAVRNEKQIDRIINYVHMWFRKHKNWLLIIDNVDEDDAFDALINNRFFSTAKCLWSCYCNK
jgi:hypothetical protein